MSDVQKGTVPTLWPVGSRIEWERGRQGTLTGYIREIQERGGWPIYSVLSNGRVYRVLPQDCRYAG